MTLIVEDGTGLPNADSYVSVADARTYAANYGYTLPADDAAVEVLLRQATRFMLTAYGALWQGARAVAGQRLDWPRTGVTAYGQDVPSNIVPGDVRDACALLGVKAQAGPLLPDGGPLVKREKVGPIETEYDNEYGRPTATPAYYDAGGLIAPYTQPRNPYSVPLVRS